MKTDASGHRLWRREYGSAYYAALFTKAQQTSDGGCVFAGYANATSSSWTQYWLVKTDSSGNVEWERTFGGAREMICTDVVETSDGGYVMAGSSNNNFLAAWLIKANAQGDSLWSRTFAVDSFAVTRSIRELPDGGFAIGASTIPHGRNNLDYWLIRTDANGDTLWTRTFGTSRHDQCSGIVATADGGYVLSGLTEPSPGVYAILLIKTGRDPVLEVAPTFILHPSSLSLSSYPNPFNSSTEIAFDLPRAGKVSLKVFDVLGREVATLRDGVLAAGAHRIQFDGAGLASGTYLLRLEAGAASTAQKITLLK